MADLAQAAQDSTDNLAIDAALTGPVVESFIRSRGCYAQVRSSPSEGPVRESSGF